MKSEMRRICGLFIFLFSLALLANAQVTMRGEISGVVVDDKGEYLPGVSITLTGETLYQKSMSITSTERGSFKFLGLNPGKYTLEISLAGFDGVKFENIEVSVGKTTPIRATLIPGKLKTEVVVLANAPLIETKTTQLNTNFSAKAVEKLPTSRNLLDLAEAVPGINDRGAYGAGGYADFGPYFKGSATSNFLINGVGITSLAQGDVWVNPAYDTIEEIQVVGVGASAEYGNFSGASINFVTKSGTNTLHGGISSYNTNHGLYGDNSKGVEDLTPDYVKYKTDNVFYLGGPIIKEKLFFFGSLAYRASEAKGFNWDVYGSRRDLGYQFRLDWLATPKNTLSLMFNSDPMDHKNLGLLAGSGSEIGYTNRLRTTTVLGNLMSIFSESMFLEVKFASFQGEYKIDPNAPDHIAVTDTTNGRKYGSYGSKSDNISRHDQVNAAVSAYADKLLGAAHEFKFGLEYEWSSYKNSVQGTGAGGTVYYIYPAAGGFLINSNTGFYSHWKADVKRLGAFFQDNLTIGRKISLNVGLRYDGPKLSGTGVTGTIVQYSNWAPRIGLSYDFGADAKNVLHLHYGRYYDRINAQHYYRALNWGGPIKYYYYYTTERFVPTEENFSKLDGLVNRPENFSWEYGATPIPVETNQDSYTDVFNVGFEKLLLDNFALSIDYIHKWDRGFSWVQDHTVHTYQEIQWTDPFLHNTVPVWNQVDRLAPKLYIGASSHAKRNHDFLIVTLRKRETGRWSMLASYTYQHSRGNISNASGEAFGANKQGYDTNPNWYLNPLRWGEPWLSRPHQFKFVTSYTLPLGFLVSADLRLLSGNTWTPMFYSSYTRDFYINPGMDIPLDKFGSRRMPTQKLLDFRLAKSFRLAGSSRLELDFDVLNVFNDQGSVGVCFRPTDVYGFAQTSSFGKSQIAAYGGIGLPRRVQLGVRWLF